MNSPEQHAGQRDDGGAGTDCGAAHAGFSAYLDGAMSGVEMAAISAHLEACEGCAAEFAAWRDVQRALGELGPAQPPVSLQARLRTAIAVEREQGTYLSFGHRALRAWKSSLAPMALPLSGGLAAALVLVGALGWIFAAPISVQANDDRMAHMVAPHYMYSQVPPRAVETHRDIPVVVEAQVDTRGRVYDYTILAGPTDQKVRIRIEDDLLASVFQPATVFGVPVNGHVVLTYAGVSVRG
jgi:anti-sigma factor RsiW